MNSVYQMVRLQGRSIRLSQQEYWIHRIFDENPSIPVIRSAYWMPLWFVMHSLNSLILEDSRSNADILQSEKHRCRKRGL